MPGLPKLSLPWGYSRHPQLPERAMLPRGSWKQLCSCACRWAGPWWVPYMSTYSRYGKDRSARSQSASGLKEAGNCLRGFVSVLTRKFCALCACPFSAVPCYLRKAEKKLPKHNQDRPGPPFSCGDSWKLLGKNNGSTSGRNSMYGVTKCTLENEFSQD